MTKTIILNVTKLTDGTEYLYPEVLIDENDLKSFEYFNLAKCVCDVLNYYQENSPDAFGNAPYARLDGYMRGYINGNKMDLEYGDDYWSIKKGNRVIMKIGVPKNLTLISKM